MGQIMTSEKDLKWIKECKYAVIAINSEGRILHTIFQNHKPTENDFLEYEEELATDEELGMVDEDDYYLIEANEPTIVMLKRELLDDTR